MSTNVNNCLSDVLLLKEPRFSTTIDLVNYLKPYCSNLYGYDAVVD